MYYFNFFNFHIVIIQKGIINIDHQSVTRVCQIHEAHGKEPGYLTDFFFSDCAPRNGLSHLGTTKKCRCDKAMIKKVNKSVGMNLPWF